MPRDCRLLSSLLLVLFVLISIITSLNVIVIIIIIITTITITITIITAIIISITIIIIITMNININVSLIASCRGQHRGPAPPAGRHAPQRGTPHYNAIQYDMYDIIHNSSEGEDDIRLESLVELEFINSSFSISNSSIRAFRAYPLVEVRQFPVEQFEATASQSTLPPPS